MSLLARLQRFALAIALLFSDEKVCKGKKKRKGSLTASQVAIPDSHKRQKTTQFRTSTSLYHTATCKPHHMPWLNVNRGPVLSHVPTTFSLDPTTLTIVMESRCVYG
jgi:hypothetical protein